MEGTCGKRSQRGAAGLRLERLVGQFWSRMPRPALKRKVLMGAPAIVEEAVMIIVPPPIGSAETKKSVIPSARETKAQEGYFIGWMLSNA
ncbi:MAG: hypothetical protein H0X47_02045 [Nitrospirales bacterium]|nr:hypothetical protein [Nitrospirales bacterium]